ncbi:MAG: TonB-dependent receptor [Myxococcota bacterium]
MWTALLSSWLLMSVAHADPKDDARRHFAAGLQAASDQNYAEAIQQFLAAQRAFPHPSTVYNIAKAYADSGDNDKAVEYYQRYQQLVPEQADAIAPIIAALTAPPPEERPTEFAAGATIASTKELEQLRELAKEMQALADLIAENAETAQSEAAVDGGSDTAGGGEPPATQVTPQTDFLEQAYERVVVTASRVGQDPLDSPSTISVVTAEDIRLSGLTQIADILRSVVGVDVMAMNAYQTDISIRGFNNKINNKVLILIDGRSTYLDFLGTSFLSSFPIQIEDIERIEIIRGPGSSVYGANAVTGVINIITFAPGEGTNNFRVDYGRPGMLRVAGSTTGRMGRSAYRFSAGLEQTGRFAQPYDLTVIDNPSLESFFEPSNRLGANILRINGRIDTTVNELVNLSVSGGFTQNSGDLNPAGSLPLYGFDFESSHIRGDVFVGRFHARAFWNRNEGITGPFTQYKEGRDLNADFDNDVIDVEVEAPLEFTTGTVEHTLNVGGGYRQKRIAFTYLEGGFEDNTYIENHFKAFLNEQIAIGRFGAVASLRFDVHPLLDLDDTISPRGAVIYRLFDRTTIRATVGQAFRAPNALESYLGLNLPTPVDALFIRDVENRNLRPERITTAELGFHDESTLYHQADVTLYANWLSDLINLDNVTPSLLPFEPAAEGFRLGQTGFINLAPRYFGYGAEADLSLFPVDGLDIFANANLLRIVELNEGQDPIRDGSTSTLKLNAGVAYRTKQRTDLSLSFNYVSPQTWRPRELDPATLEFLPVERQIEARFLLNARVAVRPFENEDFEVAATAWNLLSIDRDQGQLEHPEAQPLLGRLYGTVAYRF